MHHVRLLSDLNLKMSEVDKLMAKRRRNKYHYVVHVI